MAYKQVRSAEEFTAPLFIREDGYWENHMLPYLEAEGWKVIVVDCAGVKTTLDFAYRLVESIESVYAIPDDFNLRWASEDACLIDWFDWKKWKYITPLANYTAAVCMKFWLGMVLIFHGKACRG